MSETVRTNQWLTAAAWRGLFRDRPLIPLIGLLAILVAVIQLVQPGIVGLGWAGVILRASVPLAILAAVVITMIVGAIRY